MIPAFLKEKEVNREGRGTGGGNFRFLEKTTRNMASLIVTSMRQGNLSRREGFMQGLDARVKVVFLVGYVILVSLTHGVDIQLGISVFVLSFFILSRINLWRVYSRIAGLTFLFGFLVFLPASLNVFAPGQIVFTLLQFEQAHDWWIYHIPRQIGFTSEGLWMVARITCKVFNSISLTILLTSTTPFEQVIKALKVLRVPDIFLLTLTLSFQYIFIFSQTILETYQALRMRWWERGAGAEARAILSGRMGYLFRKSWDKYEAVYHSMIARGYTGSVSLYYGKKLNRADYLFLLIALLFLVAVIFFNIAYA